MYTSLIYCGSLWAGTSKTLLNPICVLQKSIVRAGEMFHEIGLLKFDDVLHYIDHLTISLNIFLHMRIIIDQQDEVKCDFFMHPLQPWSAVDKV